MMNKEQAIEAMKQGKRVTHTHFDSNEWMTMTKSGDIFFEDGVKCDPYEFWRWRTDSSWDNGYQLWN